jgi:hypothetical protein
MAKQRTFISPSKEDRRAPSEEEGEERWLLAAIGIAIALIAILVQFLDDELANAFDLMNRDPVDFVARSLGMAGVAAGLVGLWRGEVQFACGAAMVLGAVAIFFETFLFIVFVAAIIGVIVALVSPFFDR